MSGKGRIWLDFDNGIEEAHHSAIVTRYFNNNGNLVIEFIDSYEGHKFSGSCTLNKTGDSYTGSGRFRYLGDDEITSSVQLTLSTEGVSSFLSGTWLEPSDNEPYQIEVEISE